MPPLALLGQGIKRLVETKGGFSIHLVSLPMVFYVSSLISLLSLLLLLNNYNLHAPILERVNPVEAGPRQLYPLVTGL